MNIVNIKFKISKSDIIVIKWTVISIYVYVFLIVYPFYIYNLPKGSDTPVYYLYARVLSENFQYIFSIDSPFTGVISYFFMKVLSIIGITEPRIILLSFQLINGITFIITSVLFLSTIVSDKKLLKYVPVLTSTSANLLRFQPLMANLLCLNIIFLQFFLLSKIKSYVKYIVFSIFIIIAVFTHPWTAIYLYFIYLISSFLSYLTNKEQRKIKYSYISIIILFIFISILYIFITIIPSFYVDFIRNIQRTVNGAFSIGVNNIYNFIKIINMFETYILKSLGILSILIIRKYIKSMIFGFFLILLTIFSILLSFINIIIGWRFFILIPFGWFASFGLSHIHKEIHRLIKSNKLSTLIIVGIIIANFGLVFQWQINNIGPYVSYYQYTYLVNINKLDNYTIILVYPPRDVGVWAEALLSSPERKIFVYYGKLIDLYNKKPPVHRPVLFRELKMDQIDLNKYKIVIIPFLYRLYEDDNNVINDFVIIEKDYYTILYRK